MEILARFYSDLAAYSVIPADIVLGLLMTLTLLFLIQLYYYVGLYGALPKFRNNRGIRQGVPTPPISVIVVARENTYYFIEETLPLLLAQEYHTFEVVVVDCSYNEEISELLNDIRLRNPLLRLTQIKAQSNVDHSMKLALTVGIKAAQYEHLLLTTTDCTPPSSKWVALMAKGFIAGDVVIGYSGIERKKGVINPFIRCSRLMLSARYLSQAIRGHAYRGISHNIGYTKSLYFSHNGFCHLNMNIGEDDLFIQRIVNAENVSVVMNPHASTRQFQYGGLGWWRSLRRFYSYAFRFYPLRVKVITGVELWSRFLFFLVAGATAAFLPQPWFWIPLSLFLLRMMIVEIKIWQIGKRLGERGLLWSYLFYDLISPVSECLLYLRRNIKPNKAIWR